MEKLLALVGGAFLFIAAIVLIAPLATAFGWMAGWAVGLFFGDTILNLLSALGLHGFSMAQIGAGLGFISGFLRTSTSVKKE